MNVEGVFGDVAGLGCTQCDATNSTCLACADFFTLTADGDCQLNKCVEAPDGIEGDVATLGGCKTCTADNQTCLECWDFFGLTSDGTCVLVSPDFS